MSVLDDMEIEAAKLTAALAEFCDCVTTTGGVFQTPAGLYAPMIDSDWVDLGEAYLNGCEVLAIKPLIEEVVS